MLIILILYSFVQVTLCQFSSFVSGYLFNTPNQFITAVPLTQPLQNYVEFQSQPVGKQQICDFPFVFRDDMCECPKGFRIIDEKCIANQKSRRGENSIIFIQDFTDDQGRENVQQVPFIIDQQNQQNQQEQQNNNQQDQQFERISRKNRSRKPKIQVDPQKFVQCPILKINKILNNQSVQALALISRSFDGTLNNQENPAWGSTGALLQRRVQARYKDNINIPFDNLAGPRQISNAIGSQKQPIRRSRVNATIAFTIFGQFIDHDIDLTFAQRGDAKAQFMNIKIPSNDKFFRGTKQIRFTRSSFVQQDQGPRRHRNSVTSWIDGSQVYGSDKRTICALRTFKNGKLKTSGQNQQFLPLFGGFFRAGDVRAIQNSLLTAFQTIFLRQHNRICDLVLKKNPKFNDETVFQIARNFVIGLIQKIVMKDFLPILLGSKYDTIIGKYKGYKNNVNPNIPTQFSTASYRLGHSLLTNSIPLMNQDGEIQRQLRLNELFFQQKLFSQNFMNMLLRGASNTLTKQKSVQFVDDVRNLLVLNPTRRQTKLDLFSLNVQRARDHGLPTYNKARVIFNLPPIKTFEQLVPKEQIHIVKKLKAIYGKPDNLELFIGILAEKPVQDGIVGQLGAQIIGQTFRNLRDADRFWYQGAYPKSVIKFIQSMQIGDICRKNSGAQDISSNMFRF